MSWATRYIEQLASGVTVTFRPHGNSMQGKIKSGQLVTVAPLKEDPEVGDIVLCKVMGSQYLHLVTATRAGQFQISNNKGHVNGWITRNSIYGKCIKVE
jgi:hypothetical protein